MREPGEGRRHLAVRWGWWVIRDAEAERVGGRDLYQQPVDDPDAKRKRPPLGAVTAAGSAVLPARAPGRPVRHGCQDRCRCLCGATRDVGDRVQGGGVIGEDLTSRTFPAPLHLPITLRPYNPITSDYAARERAAAYCGKISR